MDKIINLNNYLNNIELNMSHIKNLVSQIDAISVDSQALVFVNKLLAKIKNHMDILSEKIKINNY